MKTYIVRISVGEVKEAALIQIEATSKAEAEKMVMKFLKVKARLNH
jgi:hypothetical protein